ncbi:hypothetical protein PF010_g13494 [Phytophthora fragariae]|uniref:Secreted protein n=1 Tax=Phytophthora fragariae TaxID=53985 RepID=A0A6A3SAK8_9STRA|nr:hypothetical protein PF003_g4242 [Phytophthora fragariae]KAE8938046.1 hypothetical protein PF009_g12063 [Phytophthora fragariae]KAE9103817.1 hypothetical protein PF006_g22073 [Phytophthora fragariae]KAE9104129.1 hypothetical protein PF010_g13494 [Phytophthora fragariae]KAE9112622.1 hypothetical protein PF007_g11024 [Phytophthora fragariae]
MDHYGTWSGGLRAWLTLILRFCILQGTSPRNASCARPEARFVVGDGVHGVGGVANDRSALVLCATAAPGRKVRARWWRTWRWWRY